MAEFLGMFSLADTLAVTIVTKTGALVPTNSTAVPSYIIYDAALANGKMANGSGSASYRHSFTMTGAADNGGGLVRVTKAAHGLTTGQRVTISGTAGATGVDGTHIVTVISSSTFDLVGSTFGGVWTSGGVVNVTGAYAISHTLNSGDGYQSSSTYFMLVSYTISAVVYTECLSFTVV